MKKILIIILLLFVYKVNSNYTVTNNNVSAKQIEFIGNYEKMKLDEIIKEIEYESEINIPSYIDKKYIKYMYDTADSLDIPIRLVFRLIFKESNFKADIISHEGAKGFMQVMPKTYNIYNKKLKLNNLNLDYNSENILIGMNLLKDLYLIWIRRGNDTLNAWKLALASYNTGIANVVGYDGIPSHVNEYLDFILKKHSNGNELI